MWVDQDPVPVGVAADWTLATNMTVVAGVLTLTAVADAGVTKRNIPGLLEGHLYEMTIVLDSIDDGAIQVDIGGDAVSDLTSAGTFVSKFRPSYGNELVLTVDNAASTITGAISSIQIRALDYVNFDLLPVL